MCDIFISHASEDKKAANEVCRALEAKGIRCWISPRNVTPGTAYAHAIVNAIGKCKILILVFSSRSNSSRQVIAELQTAFDTGKIILPFRIEDVRPTGAMIHYLGTFHWLDAFTPPLKDHLQGLVDWAQDQLSIPADKQLAKPAAKPPVRKDIIHILKPGRTLAVIGSLVIIIAALSYMFINGTFSVGHKSPIDFSHLSEKSLVLTSGGRTEEGATALAIDSSYNVYIAGYFCGTTSLGPGPDSVVCTSQGEADTYLIKLDPSGSVQWVQTWGSSRLVKNYGMALDNSRNIYIAGEFEGTVDFDPGPGVLSRSTQSNSDAYLVKLDSSCSPQWVRTWGGPGRDNARGVALDDSGNIYVTGLFEGAADLDPGTGRFERTAQGGQDPYIVMLDSSGSLQWAYTWGSPGYDYARGLAIDTAGNVYIAGSLEGDADFGPDSISHVSLGKSDACLIKLNPSGSLEWARTWGGPDDDNGQKIALDDTENVYICGYFEGQADLDPGSGTLIRSSHSKRDFFLVKLDSKGLLQWVNTWAGSDRQLQSISVAIGSSNNIYIAGGFTGTTNIASDSETYTSRGGTDAYLAQFDPSGSLLYAYSWGGLDNDLSSTIALDDSGDVHMVGQFGGTADLDPGPGVAMFTAQGHSANTYAIKADSSGSAQWVKTWGAYSHTYALGISSDSSGNIYLAGHFGGDADLDPGPGTLMCTAQRTDDAYLTKINPGGSAEWARTWGGSEVDVAHGVAVDNSGNIYITGRFQGTADLDPGTGSLMRTAQGDYSDSFLIKLDPAGSLQWARNWGGPNSDYACGVAVDSSGNAYIAGQFIGTSDLDPGPSALTYTAQGDTFDCCLIKIDKSGLLHWAKTWGGPYYDSADDIALDESSNIYVAGCFEDTTDLDPGPGAVTYSAQGTTGPYIAKFDANGSLQWARTWGGPDENRARGVTLDSSGNIFIAGYFKGTADFDPGPDTLFITSQGDFDSYLIKLDPKGALRWAHTWGGPEFDEARKITLDSHENIYIVGFFWGTADLDPGEGTYMRTAQGRDDDYIIKLDKDGNLIR